MCIELLPEDFVVAAKMTQQNWSLLLLLHRKPETVTKYECWVNFGQGPKINNSAPEQGVWKQMNTNLFSGWADLAQMCTTRVWG